MDSIIAPYEGATKMQNSHQAEQSPMDRAAAIIASIEELMKQYSFIKVTLPALRARAIILSNDIKIQSMLLVNVESQVTSLEAEVHTLKTTVEEAKTSKARAVGYAHLMESKLEDQTHAIEKAEHKVACLVEDIRKNGHLARNMELTQRVDHQRTDMMAAEQEAKISELQDRNNRQSKTINKQRETSEPLYSEINDMQGENDALEEAQRVAQHLAEGRLDTIQKLNDSFKHDRGITKRQAQENVEQREKIEELTEKLKTLKEVADATERQYQDDMWGKVSEFKVLEKQNEEAVKNIGKLLANSEFQAATISRQQTLITAKYDDTMDIQAELADKSSEFDGLMKENENLEAILADRDANNDVLADEIDNLKRSLKGSDERYQNAVMALESEIQKSEARYEQAAQRIAELFKGNNTQDLNIQKQAVLTDTKCNKIIALETEVNELKGRYDEAFEIIHGLKKKAESQGAVIHGQAALIDEKCNEFASLQVKLDAKDLEVVAIQSSLSSRTANRALQIAAKDREIQRANEAAENITDDYDDLVKQKVTMEKALRNQIETLEYAIVNVSSNFDNSALTDEPTSPAPSSLNTSIEVDDDKPAGTCLETAIDIFSESDVANEEEIDDYESESEEEAEIKESQNANNSSPFPSTPSPAPPSTFDDRELDEELTNMIRSSHSNRECEALLTGSRNNATPPGNYTSPRELEICSPKTKDSNGSSGDRTNGLDALPSVNYFDNKDTDLPDYESGGHANYKPANIESEPNSIPKSIGSSTASPSPASAHGGAGFPEYETDVEPVIEETHFASGDENSMSDGEDSMADDEISFDEELHDEDGELSDLKASTQSHNSQFAGGQSSLVATRSQGSKKRSRQGEDVDSEDILCVLKRKPAREVKRVCYSPEPTMTDARNTYEENESYERRNRHY